MSRYYFIEKNFNWEEGDVIATATNFISKTIEIKKSCWGIGISRQSSHWFTNGDISVPPAIRHFMSRFPTLTGINGVPARSSTKFCTLVLK